MRETVEWGVRFPSGEVQPLYMELLARRIAAHRPEERSVVSRKIERVTGPWEIVSE